MRKRPLAVLTALGLGGSLAVAGFIATPALAADAGHVDIRLELYFEEYSPIVLGVDNVPIGDGPELTSDDVIEWGMEMCADVEVDVDPVAQTVTVSAAAEGCYALVNEVRLTVSSPDFTAMTLVSDELLWPEEEWEECDGECNVPVAFSGGGNGTLHAARSVVLPMAAPDSLAILGWGFTAPQLTATWSASRPEFLQGSTVFSYAPAPTPPAQVQTAADGAAATAELALLALAATGAIVFASALILRRRTTEGTHHA